MQLARSRLAFLIASSIFPHNIVLPDPELILLCPDLCPCLSSSDLYLPCCPLWYWLQLSLLAMSQIFSNTSTWLWTPSWFSTFGYLDLLICIFAMSLPDILRSVLDVIWWLLWGPQHWDLTWKINPVLQGLRVKNTGVLLSAPSQLPLLEVRGFVWFVTFGPFWTCHYVRTAD